MTPKDMAKLHAAAFSTARAWSADEFAALLAHSGTFPIGDDRCFALIRTVLDEAELLTIATAPEMRRQGLARATLQACETKAKQANAEIVFLEVAEDNHAAIGLYTASGYRQFGRRPNYYVPKDGAAVAALVMRKSLTAG